VIACRGVNLHIERGQFVVITGRIGGKSTLRGAAWLLPPQVATCWNTAVDDLAAFIKRATGGLHTADAWLFSETLRDNLLMGWRGHYDGRRTASGGVEAAVLDRDVPKLDHRLETMVRYAVRLSGGRCARRSPRGCLCASLSC
jgi:ABC-type multidrug transport system fused ATPase/permease subunit